MAVLEFTYRLQAAIAHTLFAEIESIIHLQYLPHCFPVANLIELFLCPSISE